MARNISSARKPVRMSARSRFVHSLRRRGSDSELRAASRAATKSAGSAFGSVLATFGRPTNAIGPIEENKAVVGRWFTEFWGENFNPDVIGELAAPDIRFEYSLHTPCRGRDEVRAFATKFGAAFPDLAFGATADLIAEGDYVVGQWIGGGTQTGEAFDDTIRRLAAQSRWASPDWRAWCSVTCSISRSAALVRLHSEGTGTHKWYPITLRDHGDLNLMGHLNLTGPVRSSAPSSPRAVRTRRRDVLP